MAYTGSFYIDPWAALKGAGKMSQLQQQSSQFYENQQRQRVRDDQMDYRFAREQELDQFDVPLQRATKELALGQTQQKQQDLSVQKSVQDIISRGIQLGDGDVVRDINDPRMIQGMMQLANSGQLDARTSASLINREIPMLAIQQFKMNLDNPEAAVQFAKQAGLRSLSRAERNPDGTFNLYATEPSTGREVLIQPNMTQTAVSSYLTSQISKNPATAQLAQQAEMAEQQRAGLVQDQRDALTEQRQSSANLNRAREEQVRLQLQADEILMNPQNYTPEQVAAARDVKQRGRQSTGVGATSLQDRLAQFNQGLGTDTAPSQVDMSGIDNILSLGGIIEGNIPPELKTQANQVEADIESSNKKLTQATIEFKSRPRGMSMEQARENLEAARAEHLTNIQARNRVNQQIESAQANLRR